MKASLSRNLILCIEAESDSEAALLMTLKAYHITENGSGCANYGGPLEGGHREYRTYKFLQTSPQESSMSSETAGKFVNDIQDRIDYFRTEFNLSYCEAIGCLDILKHKLLEEVEAEEASD